MEKHAICIMAHKNIEQINTLLRIIDHPQIDVFLHLDSKSSIIQNNVETPRHSKLTFVKRHDVRWGDISLIEAELELFKAVVDSQQYYDRIHLISAQDLPMKSMSYILEYFGKAENKDTEFISYVENIPAKYRLKYYWFCTRHMRFGLMYKIVRHSLLLLQKIMRINRMKNIPLEFKFGSEWVSLTLSAVRYLVSEYPKHERMFRYTTCSDELYKQMLLWGQFKLSEKGNLRYIKFPKGSASPELVPVEKLPELVRNPDVIFARKFDHIPEDVIKIVMNNSK